MSLQSSASTSNRRPNNTPLRILIVDDNRDAALSMGKLLQMRGNDVRVVHSGVDAVNSTPRFNPEAVLLDIGLPDMDGYETARSIREIPGFEKIVIIAVTGWGQDIDRARSRLAGFDHHVVKPADSTYLMGLLETVRQ